MSDVREPEQRIVELSPEASTPPKRTLMSRALAPLNRRPAADPAPYYPAGTDGIQPSFDARAEIEPRRRPGIVLISLLVGVFLPVAVSGSYLFFMAADQFASESRLAVKTVAVSKDEDQQGNSVMPGASLVGQDAEIVANYIKSRAIVEDIGSKIDIRAMFQRPEADFLARLPRNASIEDLTNYWKKMISVYVESSSGIVTIEARAFRREDALLLAKAIVKSSEALVNSLSSSISIDTVKHAEDEVRRSESEVRLALAELTAYRNSQGLIDPVKSAELSGKLLLQLMGDKIQTEGELFVSQRTTSPNAPGVGAVRARLESIDSQIAKLQQQLANTKSSSNNMAASISKFEELELKLQFAERMFTFATFGLDRARLNAERQAVYLTEFVSPSLPEDYSYPLRGADFALISMAVFMTWACGATICASVLDHRL